MNRILLAVASLVLGGGLAFWIVSNQMAAMSKPIDPSEDPRNAIVSPAKVHPVTAEMEAVAKAQANATAPQFVLRDERGGSHSLMELSRTKPVILYFIVDSCPCCVAAQPYVNRVKEAYGDAVTIVGVINADAATARTWATNNSAKFPLLLDPSKATIHAYKATRGTYMALIAPGGTIDKVIPGYSQALITDLGERVAALAKVRPVKIKVDDLPKEATTGCEFDPAK